MSGVSSTMVLLGPPGSGKGTQAALLAERLGVPEISTGDMIRAAIASGNELGHRVEQIVSSGDLVDDDTMGRIVRSRLAEEDARDGFLLDGYPRTLPQALTLEAILEGAQRSLGGAILFDVPEDKLVERLLHRGRDDDREDVIRHRLAIYREQIEPLIERYREQGLLIEIDGDSSIDRVAAATLTALGTVDRLVREVEN